MVGADDLDSSSFGSDSVKYVYPESPKIHCIAKKESLRISLAQAHALA